MKPKVLVLSSILAVAIIITLIFGFFNMNVFVGMEDTFVDSFGRSTSPVLGIDFGGKYLPLNQQTHKNPYKELDVDYEKSTCEILLKTNLYAMHGDPCDGVKPIYRGVFEIEETTNGPVCLMPTRSDWQSMVAPSGVLTVGDRDCCVDYSDQAIQHVYGVSYIQFNIVEKPEIVCNNLYWFDEDSSSCGQKEFCELYMYEGLRTFETLEKCETEFNANKSNTLLYAVSGFTALILLSGIVLIIKRRMK